MIDTYICHSPEDWLETAQIRKELEGLGLGIREIQEPDWPNSKSLLRSVLREVDVVVIILSPNSAILEKIVWVWDVALTLNKYVASFLVKSCQVPPEFQGPYLYDLSSNQTRAQELLRFAGGIVRLKDSLPQYIPTNTISLSNDPYPPTGLPDSDAFFGCEGPEDAYVTITLILKYPLWPKKTRILPVLGEIKRSVNSIEVTVNNLKIGQDKILTHFNLIEQQYLAPILARLDGQETAVVAAVLDALDNRLFPAEELGQHLAVIHAALAEINARSAEIRDQQLAAAAQHAAKVVSTPGLDVKHKLKVTIPILPTLISYEGEFELSSKADLERAWQALRERFGRRR